MSNDQRLRAREENLRFAIKLALVRLDQAERRIIDAHPKAARDGQLASILGALRDELEGTQ